MQILLLSRGDAKSKDLLRRVLAARYGYGAPAMDGAKITFKGRLRVKVGPVVTWIPLEATTLYRFPAHARWDFSVRPAGLPMRSESRAFDNTAYYRRQGENTEVLTTPNALKGMRELVWASALVMLTPLTEPNVEVVALSTHTLRATNLYTHACATLYLNDDYTLRQIETHTFDVDRSREAVFRVQCSEGYQTVNDLILPRKIVRMWDDEPSYEVSPTEVILNPALDDGVFRLQVDG
ncbi:MAG: hypothetical protein U0670_05170 [Anaerolineae bacterium]